MTRPVNDRPNGYVSPNEGSKTTERECAGGHGDEGEVAV